MKRFTLDDIDYFLDDFGFEWVSRSVKDTNTNKYKQMKTNTFNGKPKFLSLKNLRGGNSILMMVEIDNEKFVMTADRYKIDASGAWKDYLKEKTQGVADEC